MTWLLLAPMLWIFWHLLTDEDRPMPTKLVPFIIMQAAGHQEGEPAWSVTIPTRDGAALILEMSMDDVERLHSILRQVCHQESVRKAREEGVEIT